MIVGIVKVVLFLPGSGSLKEKRMALRSFKKKVRTSFNITIAEIDDQDKWQRSTLAVATVGRDKASVNSLLSHLENYLERHEHFQLIDYEMELL